MVHDVIKEKLRCRHCGEQMTVQQVLEALRTGSMIWLEVRHKKTGERLMMPETHVNPNAYEVIE